MNESVIYEIRLKDRFTSPLAGLENKMNRFEGKVGGLNSAFNGLGGSIAGAFAGGLVAGGISMLLSKLQDIGSEAVRVTREFTNMKDAIMFASGENAGKNIGFLDDEINRLGLDVQSTYKGFKTFTGALMGTSLEGEKGLEIFRAVSEAATVMKLSADQTEGTFLALGQMISKGNVQAEELRGQLGERLPGAFNIFARALGVSTQKLNKMLQNGEVIAEKTLPLFAAELRKTFSPGVLSAQQSFNSNMNRFNKFIMDGKLTIGNALIPVLNDVVQIIPKLDFSPVTNTFTQMTGSISEAVGIFNELLEIVGLNMDKFGAFQGAVQYVGFVFRVAWTPIRAIIEGIKLLVTTIKAAIPMMTEFGAAMENVFTGNFKGLYENYRRLKNFAKDFGSTITSTVEVALKKESEGWSKVFNPQKAADSSYETMNAAAGMPGASGSATGTGKSSTAGVEKIHAGTRNVTINIDSIKLAEQLISNKADLSDVRIQEMLKRALLTAVNDVNIVAQ